jgi:hypothetical protein
MTAKLNEVDIAGDEPSTVSRQDEFQAFLESHPDLVLDCDEPREPPCTTEWQKSAQERHPDARIFGDGPFAVKLPCRRLSYCLFFHPGIAATVYRLSKGYGFTCKRACRGVKTMMLRSLFAQESLIGGK